MRCSEKGGCADRKISQKCFAKPLPHKTAALWRVPSRAQLGTDLNEEESYPTTISEVSVLSSVCHCVAWTLREAADRPKRAKRRAFFAGRPKIPFSFVLPSQYFLRASRARFPACGPWIGACARPPLTSIPGSCGESSCCLRFLLLPLPPSVLLDLLCVFSSFAPLLQGQSS
jgi:hypothetical protein